ncbi:hypothetical protein AKO1_002640 [Acrasis kona]|uniref:Uncharacterized protein n=1 Tax=Acrasis kona TaxID=1008807 RepID=A0AAW2ZNE7_9EUKA
MTPFESTQNNVESQAPTFEDLIFNNLQLIDEPDIHFGLDKNFALLWVVDPKFTQESIQKKCSNALPEVVTIFPQPLKKTDDRHKHIKDVDVYHFMEWSATGHPDKRCVSKQTYANGATTSIASVQNVKNAFF